MENVIKNDEEDTSNDSPSDRFIPLDIRHDNVFKAVFTKGSPESRGALSRLVSALIGSKITVETIAANEPPINNIRDRQIRFDISCKTENGELINVEMSLNPASFEPSRIEYYAGRLFTSQDIRGIDHDYDDLKQAFQITILANGLFFPDEEFIHTFMYYDPVKCVTLNGKSRIIILELSKLDNVVDKPTEAMTVQEYWAVYFRYLTDKSKAWKISEIIVQEEGIAMANEVLFTISKNEIERARLESELKYELDMQSYRVHAKKQGRKEGLEEGRKEGLEEGREQGREEGLQEIINLLKSGKSPEEIIMEYDR